MDFLAREQELLGATEAAALFGDEKSLFPSTPQVQPEVDTVLFPEIPMTENTIMTSPQPKVQEESPALLNFKENFKAVLIERDEKSKSKHDLILKNAKNSIEKFYAEYNDKKSKNIARNKEILEKPMSDSLSVWEKTIKLIDAQGVHKTADKNISKKKVSGKDTSRMKEVLTSLKGDKNAPIVDSLTKKAKEFSLEKKAEILKSIKGYQSPNSLKKGVFGVELTEALTISKTRGLPTVVANTLDFLSQHTSEVGIYRVSAAIKEINALAKEFQNGQTFEISPDADVHAVAAVLKMYLRELPSCIITDHVKQIFFNMQHSNDSSSLTPKSENDTLAHLNYACQFLPEENRTLAFALFSHLHQVVNDSELNKMGVLNLQLIFSPCLNIEPLVIQCLIKYPEILKKKRQIKFENNYELQDAETTVENRPKFPRPNEAPQKPIRKTVQF